MTIVPRTDGNVTAYFQHTCGHSPGILYAGEEFAECDQEQAESVPCLECRIASPCFPHSP